VRVFTIGRWSGVASAPAALFSRWLPSDDAPRAPREASVVRHAWPDAGERVSGFPRRW
jgi:hypothetical protein